MGGSAPSGCSDRSLRLQRSRPGTFPPPDRVPGPLLGANSQLGACASGTGAQANNGRRFSNSLPQIIRRSVIRHRSRVRSGKQHDTGISQPAVCALNCLFDSRKLVIWAYGEAETPNLPCHRLLGRRSLVLKPACGHLEGRAQSMSRASVGARATWSPGCLSRPTNPLDPLGTRETPR